MKNIYSIRFLLIVIAGVLTLSSLAATSSDDFDVNAIVEEIDKLYRSRSSYAEMEMEVITPHWQRTLAMDVWTIGLDKTFLRINSPIKEKGVATLRIENEMWNFLPKTNKVIKIPPSMMMNSWMGSDFTNDDLVKEFSLFEDYTYELITVDSARPELVYVNCIPREDLPIVWGNIVIAAQKEDHIPVWQKYYDEKGNLMRIMSYHDIKLFGDREIPAVIELVPQNKEGHKTVIRYLKLEFDKDIDEKMFSLRHLQSQR